MCETINPCKGTAKLTVQPLLSSYWELAIELGCDWVHLGQEDLDEADIGALKNMGLNSVKTHDQDELDRALTLSRLYRTSLYPTFKKNEWHEQGLPRVTNGKNYWRYPAL